MTRHAGRGRSNEALIYGLQPVREALRAGQPIRALHVHRGEGADTMQLLEDARTRGIPIVEATRRELEDRAGSRAHQGLVAYLGARGGPKDDATVGTILDRARAAGDEPLVLLLDGVEDPRNLGAIIRTAYAFGAHGVMIPRHRAAPVTPTAVKASAGAAAHLPVARLANLKHAFDELREAGVWIAAATLEGDPIERCRLDGPLAIVLGAEGKGVRPSVAESCDLRVTIPLSGAFDSLNVSVAAGILLYEAVRQRRARKAAPKA